MLPTTMCRLRPFTFLPPSTSLSAPWWCVATVWLSIAAVLGSGSRPGAARTCRLRASTIDEGAVLLQPSEVIPHRGFGRKVVGQVAPLTTGARDVQNRIHDL